MQLNLNSIAFNDYITREDILLYVTQEQIYSFYIGENVEYLGVFHSPLRQDKIPSFALYFHKNNNNILMFKDLATNDCGDFVVLVMKMYRLSYYEALWKVAYDMGISQFKIEHKHTSVQYTKLIQKEKIELGIKTRNWQQRDKQYWSKYGITKETLIKFNVYPITHVFYNNNAVKTSELAYCYVENKDGVISYKIYQPLETKLKKWITNNNSTVHQGYTQLPQKGNTLIITKSLKDVMSIHDCLAISAIGLQSESIMMKDSVMEEYKLRFNNVICLFDNDEAGKALTQKFSTKYNIPYFYVPMLPKVTDFSDLVYSVGKEEAVKITKKLINEIRN